METYLIAASSGLALMGTLGTIAKVAAGLGFVIFVHELGHFLAAKACGVKCEKFYVGFDVPIKIGPIQLPRTLGKFRWGETEYGIGILPLGGYVKMLGQDDDPRKTLEEAERIKQSGEGAVEYKLDPRSYPAKTVPQRMLIISAGVIMNLIFAVLFATAAYRGGVEYMPCEVSAALPGSPAWVAGFSPGDRILQIGKNGRPSEHLRHDWDLRQSIGIHGEDEELPFLVRRADGKEDWITVRPYAAVIDGSAQPPAIGVRPGLTTVLAGYERPDSPLGGAPESSKSPDPKQPQPGDKIVAVDDAPIADFAALQRLLLDKQDQPLKIVVERAARSADGSAAAAPERIELTVDPVKRRRFGVAPAYGPIAGVRQGSPADKAGVLPGDRLVAVAGQKIDDILQVGEALRKLVGQEIEVELVRGADAKPVVVKLTPSAPESLVDSVQAGMQLGLEPLGVSLPVERTIAAVLPGSSAEKQGLKPGDKLVRGRFTVADAALKSRLMMDGDEFPIEDHGLNWAFLEAQADWLPTDVGLELKVERGSELITVALTANAADGYLANRGLVPQPKSEVRVAATWSEAFGLGARQTFEDASRVLALLKRLVTGRVSVKNLGGPGSIAAIAGMEAQKGWTSLLMFLTLLSANLAVLNFMPVPALDGGHMMFLTWEWLVGKPVNERVQMGLTMFGVACLLGLMLVVSSLDVWRLFQWLGS